MILNRPLFIIFALVVMTGDQGIAQTKVSPKDGLTYVHIAAGTFTMGCSPGDRECSDDEIPSHSALISRAFWLGQTAVTAGAYKKYAASHAKPMPPPAKYIDRDLNPGWLDEKQPIVNVTWTEAVAFCEASGGRLPTEAEFEYAARAGNTSPRYGALNDIAWYANNSGNRLIDAAKIQREDPRNYGRLINENKDTVKSVATKQPNAFRLYDMLGNVFEWTADWFAKYGDAPVLAPKGPSTGEYRVVKGGNWTSEPRAVRASGRNWFIPSLRNMGIGFRCAAD